MGQVTFGSNVGTLDLLRLSASEVRPGEDDAIAGLVKGSVIYHLALTGSDRHVTSGSSDQNNNLSSISAVRSRGPLAGTGV